MDKNLEGPPDDYGASLRGDVVNLYIPRSTMVVGGALWGVLLAIAIWTLTSVLALKEVQAEDRKAIAVYEAVMGGRVEAMETRENLIETQITRLEERTR